MAFRTDPWNAYYFALEIDGREIGYFMECSGLKTAAEVFEIEEGGMNAMSYKRPGRSKWENIILKTATNPSMELLEWRDSFLQDNFSNRKDGAIIQYDLAGIEIRRYNFKQGWPVTWEGPQLRAGASELAIETLEIAHEGLGVNNSGVPLPTPPPADPTPKKLDMPPIQFEFDSAELTPEGHAAIEQVHAALEAMELDEVWIEGHTSTSGSFSYNKNLSEARAQTVMRELQARNPDRTYHTMGFGWKYPEASNASKSGMDTNRRTDFYTSSFAARGRDSSPVTPENSKYDPPYNHRDNAAAAERQG